MRSIQLVSGVSGGNGCMWYGRSGGGCGWRGNDEKRPSEGRGDVSMALGRR